VPEIQATCIDNYTLCTYYCRRQALKGGLCIFINNNLTLYPINLENYCVDKDIEACAIQLQYSNKKNCILMIYRSPIGDFPIFMTHLENLLQFLYNLKMDLIICGDINIEYLRVSNRVKQLNTLLKTYNLSNIINFPTRIGKTTSTAIDTIFMDIFKYDSHFASSLTMDYRIMKLSCLLLSNQQIMKMNIPNTHTGKLINLSIKSRKLGLSDW
jgi:hypothetical protein